MAIYYSKNGIPFGKPPYTDEEKWEFEQRLRRGGDITIIRQRQRQPALSHRVTTPTNKSEQSFSPYFLQTLGLVKVVYATNFSKRLPFHLNLDHKHGDLHPLAGAP